MSRSESSPNRFGDEGITYSYTCSIAESRVVLYAAGTVDLEESKLDYRIEPIELPSDMNPVQREKLADRVLVTVDCMDSATLKGFNKARSELWKNYVRMGPIKTT